MVEGLAYSNPMFDWAHNVLFVICVNCYVLVLWGNSLSFVLTVLFMASGSSDDSWQGEGVTVHILGFITDWILGD